MPCPSTAGYVNQEHAGLALHCVGNLVINLVVSEVCRQPVLFAVCNRGWVT